MPFDPRQYMKLMFYTICLLLVCSYLFAGEKILHSKIKSIQPEKTDGQYCFIKVVIKQKGDEIIKEEILECADGKKALIPQVIGIYLLSFIIETLMFQNTADIIVGRDTLLEHQEKCVYK